jgi:orotidine-5'-phosphate decarboxylase
VKINSAFFESYLTDGVEAYHAVIQEAAGRGLMVIGDVKRGDIGNTAKHYATASLADPDFDGIDDTVGPDAVTINSYMGGDTVEPFMQVARDYGKGLFALVRTSNPGAAELQDVKLENGAPLYMHVGKLVAKWGAKDVGQRGYSLLGAVVGATNAQQLAELRAALPTVLFLVPGLGAQGGTASDAAKAFKSDGTGAIINSSRGIIFAYKDAKYKDIGSSNWEKAIEMATLETKRQISEALGR